MLCAITGIAGKPDGTVYASATFIIYRAPMSVVAQDGRVVAPIVATIVSGADGSVALSLLSGNYVGVETASKVTFPFTVPENPTADWAACVQAAPAVVTPTFPASQLVGTLLAAQEPAHTGDVTNPAGSLALTIAPKAVSNTKMADMAARALKGNLASTVAPPADLSVAQVRSMIMLVDLHTRADLVVWVAANTAIVGLTVRAAGLRYRYIGTGTAISDLPGYVPDGDVYPNHWATNVLRVTDMTQAFKDAYTYLGTFNAASQGRPMLNLAGEEYLVSDRLPIRKDFTTTIGVGARSSIIVVADSVDEAAMKYLFDAANVNEKTTQINEVQFQGFSVRKFSASTELVAFRVARGAGTTFFDVKVNAVARFANIEGGTVDCVQCVHTFGLYSASLVVGTYSVGFFPAPMEDIAPVVATSIPFDCFFGNCNFKSEDQNNPRLDMIFYVRACDGIIGANLHLLGAGGRGAVVLSPQKTAASPNGSKVTWLTGNWDIDGGSTYGIYVEAVPDGLGGFLAPDSYGVIEMDAIFSRHSVNHIYVEEGAAISEVKIDAKFRYAGDSGIVLMGGSGYRITGNLDAAGQNGNTGVFGEDTKKSAIVLGDGVTDVDIDLHLLPGSPLTMTTGVQVLSATVDRVRVRGSAYGVPTPILDDHGGSKDYDIASEKQIVYPVDAVNSGSIQWPAYSHTVFGNVGDTEDIVGGVRRHPGVIRTYVAQSSQWVRHGEGSTLMRLAGEADVQLHYGDSMTWEYSEIKGWVEIGRTGAKLPGQPWLTPPTGEYAPMCNGNGSGTSTVAGVANRLNLYQFYAPVFIPAKGFAINCTAAVAAALAKVLVYSSDNNGRTLTPAFESANLDLSTTGVKDALVDLDLMPGRTYWVGVWHSSTASIATWPTAAVSDINGGTPVSTARKTVRRTVTFGGAAPTPWNWLGSEISSDNGPAVWIKF